MFEDLLAAWGGEHVVIGHEPPARTWMFVCIDSTGLGPGAGGTRMNVYARPADALRDGMRLAEAMTLKNAAAGLPFGGGKAVLAVPAIPRGEARRRVLLRYADLVTSLRGGYLTAPDMNTSEADMDLIGTRCPHVFGRSEAAGGSGNTAPATAVGLFHGIRASVAYAFGSDDLPGRSVLIQGVGGVGRRLAELLTEAGATVLAADVEAARVRELSDIGVRGVAPRDAFATECDVFSPCATGGMLSAASIPELRCRIVAGAANNQLADTEDAERLSERGILYAPDFIINAGGVLSGLGIEALGWSRERLDGELRAIGDRLQGLYEAAGSDGITTERAARRLAAERLAAGSVGSPS